MRSAENSPAFVFTGASANVQSGRRSRASGVANVTVNGRLHAMRRY